MTLDEFLKKYDIGTSFEEMYTVQAKLDRVNNFTFKKEAYTSDRRTYLEGLRYMFLKYVENKIDPKKFDHGCTEDISIVQFMRDYEEAKQDEFVKSGSKRERQPYEGMETQALNMMYRLSLKFNRSLDAIWADLIRNGADLEKFRSVTIEAEKSDLIKRGYDLSSVAKSPAKQVISNDDPEIGVDEEEFLSGLSEEERARYPKKDKPLDNSGPMLIDDEANFPNIPNELQEDPKNPQMIKLMDKKSNTLTIVAYRAMEAVVDKRTVLWRLNPFNWRRWYQENKLMSELEEKLKATGQWTYREEDPLENPIKHARSLIDGILWEECSNEVISDSLLDSLEIMIMKKEAANNKAKNKEPDGAEKVAEIEAQKNLEVKVDEQDINLDETLYIDPMYEFHLHDAVESGGLDDPDYEEDLDNEILNVEFVEDEQVEDGVQKKIAEQKRRDKEHLGLVKESVPFVNGEFKEDAVDKSAKVEAHSAPAKDKVIE